MVLLTGQQESEYGCQPRVFLMGASENKCQISQNDILHMKFLEFYLCFHSSREI